MSDYDLVADSYDDHFRRPVDEWEDDRLSGFLAPHVNGRTVLDLGCGTGWLLDNLDPAYYLGVDSSPAMLDRLLDKHPSAEVVKAQVGEPGWIDTLPQWTRGVDTVTATWSAHELGDVGSLLLALSDWTLNPTEVLLHGQGPRYRYRSHYVLDREDERQAYLGWTPAVARQVPFCATFRGLRGTGACPDEFARQRAIWAAFNWLPARYHWAMLAHWTLEC